MSELSSGASCFDEQTTDTRYPLLTIKNSQNVLSGPGLRFSSVLSNLPAFLYEGPVPLCAPSLPKTSPTAQREDSSDLAEVQAMLHAVDGGNPPGMQRAERGV